jgi:large subunit ribosomal protein L29
MMKAAALREMSADELSEGILALRKELFDARYKRALQQLEDTAVFRRLRHQIAQMETVLREKQGEPVHA